MAGGTERRLVERIDEVMQQQKLDTIDGLSIETSVRRMLASVDGSPHSYHFNVIDGRKNKMHLRVLTWTSPKWRALRLECIEHHARIYSATKRTERAFRVPKMIRHDDTSLVWDLTEYVDAFNLPWLFPGQRKLQEHLRRIDSFIEVSDDMAKIRLKGVEPRDWKEFTGDVKRWARWSERVGIISQPLLDDIVDTLSGFDGAVPPSKPVLTHGDYGPSNLMFSKAGKPLLIDFDHLRLSLPGDNLARLLTVSYYEAAWRERLFDKALDRFADQPDCGFAAAAAWHTMNTWRMLFGHHAPGRAVTSLDQLLRNSPKLRFHINQQRKLLQRIVRTFP